MYMALKLKSQAGETDVINTSPAVVSVIPLLERMKISKPISFSSACIADDRLGCDIYSFLPHHSGIVIRRS
ncbi:MAG: hypothetical protein U0I40_00965 [Oscillospiraceae bacterium]|nr:hypothetical protein [Oscillospiraceae bacterium]